MSDQSQPSIPSPTIEPGGTRRTYLRRWRPQTPGCCIFLVDQSAGMGDVFCSKSVAAGQRTMDVVATIVNKAISDFASMCVKNDHIVPRFDLGVIGYGDDVCSILPPTFVDRELVSIADLANNPWRLEKRWHKELDYTGEIIEYDVDFPIWIEPRAGGGTPMCAALRKAASLAHDWAAVHPSSFPPIVFNISDGAATDGDPREPSAELFGVSTEDGSALLFNAHVTRTSEDTVLFPDKSSSFSHDFWGETLFAISSELPERFRNYLDSSGVAKDLPEGARGLLFNGDAVDLAQFLASLKLIGLQRELF